MVSTAHSTSSSCREMALEHLFVGAAMRYCWRHGLPHIEMLKSQVDNSGYDIVLEASSVMRHVQLKASHVDAATSGVSINVALAKKPSGCVVWISFDPRTLEFRGFRWFGPSPGEPLANLDPYRIGTHTKRNAQGVKTERPKIRYLPKAAFPPLDTIDAVVTALFGDGSAASSAADDEALLTQGPMKA